MEPRVSGHIAFDCHYRVVWCPKYRKSVLIDGVDLRLRDIISQVCEEKQAILEEMEIMPDHVHLLVSVDPQFGVHRLTKAIKSRSSRVLREEFPWLRSRIPTLWTHSYYVGTMGGADIDAVKRYIENQKTV